MTAARTERLLVFDLGKTGCRGARYDGDRRVLGAQGPGSVGLAQAHGVQAAVAAVAETARHLDIDAAGRVDRVVVGLAGLSRARHRAGDLAAALAARLGVDAIVLTSDMTTAHAGALGGEPGVVVAAGTGAVALGVDAHGRSAVCDGWGYLLGDDGSGYAVGRAGLASALRHQDGRGGSAVLHALARRRYGGPEAPDGAEALGGPEGVDGPAAVAGPDGPEGLDGLPSLVHGSPNAAREVAAFAVDVRAAAEQGDADAVAIWQQAGRDLARCAAGAARRLPTSDVIVTTTGGLFGTGPLLDEPFAAELRRLLPHARRVRCRGDALAGARLLAGDRTLPHEGLVLRFGDPRVPASSARSESGRAASTSGDTGPDVALHGLETEAARDDLAGLDAMTSREVVAVIMREDATVPAVVAQVGDVLAAVVDEVVDRLRAGGRLVYVGAGTSGRLAVLDAAELLPTYGVGADTVVALMAGGRPAVLAAAEGAEDDEAAAERDLSAVGAGGRDVVVGVTASGRTPYVLAAVDAARKAGAVTVGVSNNRGTALSTRVDHAIEVPTGPEVVAGSTRMKAGTAQKLVLNALSTAAMVRLGKVYGNRMVDMRATNEKLRRRAQRMVVEVTGADAQTAESALREAGGHVKTAIVALLADIDAVDAAARLDRAGGSVRTALRTTKADVDGTDPAGTDPAGTDPAGPDPAGGDPAGPDPAGGDPAGPDPAGGDPAGPDPAGGDPAGTDAGAAR